MVPRLQSMNDADLLKLYAEVMEALRSKGITRTSNNPVADYAEKLAVEHLGLIRAGKEARGYDAEDKKGRRYQMKGRRITRHNKSRQLSVIRDLDEQLFDFLVAVIFDENFNVLEMWQVPHQWVKENGRWSKHVNGHLVNARTDVLTAGKGVERVA